MKNRTSKLMLRYGENPNQKGYLINDQKYSISNYQISGKQLSYNNLIDLDSGLRCLKEFFEPTSIILKHTNPCGIASAINIEIAFNRSYETDPKSAFGGIIFLNRKVTSRLAKKIRKNFYEMIVALDFDRDALKTLEKKKNLILLKIPNIKIPNIEYRSTLFGDLYQTSDLKPINKKFLKLVSKKSGSIKSINDLVFSLKVAKHLKSNAIVLSRNKQTLGLGHGHTNRIDALYYAIKNMNKYFKKGSFVCASDGFFPFVDSIKLLNTNGCNAIAQPEGSINDELIISSSIKNKISLYFTKNRLFKH
tara:strand:- start:6729 stop:7646 length:918 start_codon:yes stop_codon:yes gene_type:complete